MKKTFILLIILILGIKSYSQTLVTLDSIVEKTEANPFVVRTFFIYSDLDDSISSIIVEKGILLDVHDKAFLFDTVPAIDNIEFPLEIESFIYLPIHNEAFDTILYFGSTDATILLQSYLITGSDTIYNDSIFEIQLYHVGLEDVYNSNFSCKVYPTLIDKEINISSDKYPISLSVIDLFGREVLRKEINSNKAIDLGSLKKGTYILKLKHKDAIVNRKIIKK
jgi:hypothetical protein